MAYMGSAEIEQMIARAHLAILREQFTEARGLLEQVVALDPANRTAKMLLLRMPPPPEVEHPGPASPLGPGPSPQEASEIARRAGREERARLRALSYSTAYRPWDSHQSGFSLSDHLFNRYLSRIPMPMRYILFTAAGALLMCIPIIPNFGMPMYVNAGFGAFVGFVLAFWTVSD